MKGFRVSGAAGFVGSIGIALAGVVLIWAGDRTLAVFDGIAAHVVATALSAAGLYVIRWGARLDYRADQAEAA